MFSTMLLLAQPAAAQVAPECVGAVQTFDDEGQQNFLQNYFALATTLSPTHGPIPAEGGHGSIGLDVLVIPPLSCEQRMVLGGAKTEDTNKAPMAPRPRMIFAFPEMGNVTIYGGAGYVPPVTLFGTRSVIMSGELGAGMRLGDTHSVGLRGHATLMKTVAEIATPFVEGSTPYDDFYSGSTFGVDLMYGFETEKFTPYLAVGFTDVSTFFVVGDDAYLAQNTDPYFGLTASAGVQAHVLEKIDLAAEFYTAPGAIYTGRVRVAYKL
ncbi:MAG: opacity protein-like surface antigen [Cognaticolwellia sp.]|jgi:opacity protein-like surface antigen